MIYETFYLNVPNEGNAKFTIKETLNKGKLVHYACVVSTEIDFYKELQEEEKASCIGTEIRDDEGKIVLYSDREMLKNDIITLYGIQRLKSKIE